MGDLVLKLDGTVIPASRPEEADVFETLIRQYRIGTEVVLTIRRGNAGPAGQSATRSGP